MIQINFKGFFKNCDKFLLHKYIFLKSVSFDMQIHWNRQFDDLGLGNQKKSSKTFVRDVFVGINVLHNSLLDSYHILKGSLGGGPLWTCVLKAI